MLNTGDLIPLNINVKDDQNNDVTLKDFLTKDFLVIYFYPADDTPGCTVEACEFRDANSEIEELGARIVGISPDGVKSHGKFRKKFSLNFPLLSDETHALHEAFGNWQEKSMFGKTFMGTIRSTFIINKQGKVAAIWEKVKPEGHSFEILEKIKELVNS